MSRAFVIGAGLAGLVAAERLSAAGHQVVVLEASPKAGGRCRSYRDTRLDRVIDNGNHLVLSANKAVLDWASRIGGHDAIVVGAPEFPFLDVASQQSWTIRPGSGPWGALKQAARPPGVPLRSLVRDVWRLVSAGQDQTVAQVIGQGLASEAFWDPMTLAVLNEPPQTGSARLLSAALLRSFAKGAASVRPVFAPKGLGAALIDPAVETLRQRDVSLRLRQPATALIGQTRLQEIRAGAEVFHLGPDDVAILAVPPRQAASLLQEAKFPGMGQSILNAHFLLPESGLPPLLGLVGGQAHWLFRRGDVVSVTVSAAEATEMGGMDRDMALARLWADVSVAVRVHGGSVPQQMPTARLLREKAATFDQSPGGVAMRAGSQTRWRNLFLAGDHIDTGLPATLEGAVRSGLVAAEHAIKA